MANVQTINALVRIAIVDDDQDVHLCFNDILEPIKNFKVCGSFSSATEALHGLPKLQPDLALMDIRLPDLGGIECAELLKQLMPHLKIVMVTGTYEQNYIGASLRAGALAFLIKPIEREQLVATLEFVMSEGNKMGQNLEEFRANFFLTPREKEVITALAEGFLYKEISEQLGISYAAVHKHQHNVFKKLRVTNRSEATRVWLGGFGS